MPPVRKSRKARNPDNTDCNNTFVDWGKFSIAELREKCTEHGVQPNNANRTKAHPQKIIFQHFHPRHNVEDNDIVLPEIRQSNENTNLNSEIVETLHVMQHQNKNLETNLQSKSTNEITRNSQHSEDELVTNVNTPLSNNVSERCVEIAQDSSPVNILDPALGFRAEELSGMHNNVSFNPTSSDDNSNNNPFVLPPMKTNIMKKLQQSEFIDFEDLLPPNIITNYTTNTTTTQDNVGVQINMDNSDTFKIKTVMQNKQKIHDFKTWMSAWNTFYQASLHVNIRNHFITEFSWKFKFNYVLAYDRAHRLQIASQVNMHKNQQTILWVKQNDELFNMYLQDNYLPQCYHCLSVGHYAMICPKKQKINAYPNTSNQTDPHMQKIQTNKFRGHQVQTNFRGQQDTQLPTTRAAQFNGLSNTNNTCFRFNRSQPCDKPPCRFAHKCSKCLLPGHPSIQCATTTNTTFRP